MGCKGIKSIWNRQNEFKNVFWGFNPRHGAKNHRDSQSIASMKAKLVKPVVNISSQHRDLHNSQFGRPNEYLDEAGKIGY
jgi:hypothetical protein